MVTWKYRNLIFLGLSRTPPFRLISSSPVGAGALLCRYKPVFLLLPCQTSQGHWPCYRSPKAPAQGAGRKGVLDSEA